ncbi:MAG TPA: hypothetical protein VK630_04215 [Reyranella sp.]|nr:hypothetical protein [Reyranella sp.]
MIRPDTLLEWTWPSEMRPWRLPSRRVGDADTSGPWDAEPDKRQWIDDATSLPCLMHRGTLGSWCGYVGVAPGHRFHRKAADKIADHVHAHGGINFAEGCQASDDPAMGVCHVAPGAHDKVWWIGFDCAHVGDMLPGMFRLHEIIPALGGLPKFTRGYTYRDLAYVECEVTELARQLSLSRDALAAESSKRLDAFMTRLLATKK